MQCFANNASDNSDTSSSISSDLSSDIGTDHNPGFESEFSIGAGFQYSGLLGAQFALKDDDIKYYLSVGLPGFSVGLQKVVSDDDHHSVGFSLGELSAIYGDNDNQYGFLTYNYHLHGFKNGGLVFGTGVGVYQERIYSSHGPHIEEFKPMFTLDIGYKF